MEITLSELLTETVFTLRGRFDAHETPRFKKVTSAPKRNVRVDLEEVLFIDSSALAALIGLYRRCREAGHELLIMNIQDPVRLILEITQLDRVLPVEFKAVAKK